MTTNFFISNYNGSSKDCTMRRALLYIDCGVEWDRQRFAFVSVKISFKKDHTIDTIINMSLTLLICLDCHI